MDVDADTTTANDNAAAAAAASQGDIGPGTTIRKMYDGVWYPGKVEEVSSCCSSACFVFAVMQSVHNGIMEVITTAVCAQHLK
jgi:hypothetical protein